MLRVACDITEITAVFFLAVEAIKVENLSSLKGHWNDVYRRVNPKVVFVDEWPKNHTFTQKYQGEFFLIIGYVVGIVALLGIQKVLGYSQPVYDGLSSILIMAGYYLLLPFFIFAAAYSGFVFFMERTTLFFEWIEKNTASGIVGIVGFLLYMIQYLLRRAFDL